MRSKADRECAGMPMDDLAKHPVDGFAAGLVDGSNVFEWQATIIGPPDTL
ncbi:ubiquitin-conjugating enzyme E2 7 [Panicum miliaceum]|uniref:Ubiquitin-conjugating enzyme E2 7 n=1 Tax=Panicum miliaceum TaxID=4540 RepID=A0A3L6PIF3_PANMI|nr:ubiquitin-conjugating enzyme E2 7 [Panicum miliaceum]